jgi:hypothetical protein
MMLGLLFWWIMFLIPISEDSCRRECQDKTLILWPYKFIKVLFYEIDHDIFFFYSPVRQ